MTDNQDSIDYAALAGNLECRNDISTALAGSIKSKSQPQKAGSAISAISWLFLFLASVAVLWFGLP